MIGYMDHHGETDHVHRPNCSHNQSFNYKNWKERLIICFEDRGDVVIWLSGSEWKLADNTGGRYTGHVDSLEEAGQKAYSKFYQLYPQSKFDYLLPIGRKELSKRLG